MENFYLLVIAGLIAYIIFLHISMVRKNIFIESTLRRLSGTDKKWKMDEMMKFLEEIKKLSFYTSFFNDKLFDDDSLNFIFENIRDSKIYIHYTKDEADVKNILSNGFKFADTFYKTALPISDDKLDLIVKHNSRRYFGDYLVLICISNKIINNYSSELFKAGVSNFFIENILTETPPTRNENSDLVFLLPKQFIKGYINHRTGEIVKNMNFNPEYSSSGFRINVDNIINSNN
jgi:hypothetical protein